MSDTLLSYAVSANQEPIQVSPQTGDPSLVTLMIVVSNSTHDFIECQSISFGFLQGTDAKDFFADSTGIGTAAPTGWTITQDGALFTATPDTEEDGQIGAGGLAFVLSNIQVNQQPGTTEMTITENNAGTLQISLAKFPVQFAVGQLTANPVSVNQGDSTTLSWNCTSGATYALQYMDENGENVNITETTNGQLLPAVGSYTVDNLQVNPTIFFLIVTLPVAGQNQSVVFDSSCVVTVAIPLVTINSFTASQTTVEYPGDTVTFTWDVTAATQVQLNDVSVEGNSATIPIYETGTVTLEASGSRNTATSTILVTVSSVKINSFTASAFTVYGNNNNVPVTLAWVVQSANQLLLNNNVVTGQSAIIPVNETSSFTLEATGYNGPVYDEIGVTVAPVNLSVSTDSNGVNVSFYANPGTYSSFMYIYLVFYGSSKPIFVPTAQSVTTSSFGQVQFSQGLGQIMPVVRIIYVEVILSGFPSGSISTIYTPN